MKDIKNIFRGLEKLLKEAKWFDEDWEIYNRGPYLQLYKTTWFNHNQGGIHFETSIEAPQLKEKAFPIATHAEEDCPSQSYMMSSDYKKEPSYRTYSLREILYHRKSGVTRNRLKLSY